MIDQNALATIAGLTRWRKRHMPCAWCFWGPRAYSFQIFYSLFRSGAHANKHNAQEMHIFRLLLALKSKYYICNILYNAMCHDIIIADHLYNALVGLC